MRSEEYFLGEVKLLVPGLQCGAFLLGESGVLRVLAAWRAREREVGPVMSLARCGVCGSIGWEQGDALWFLPADQVGGEARWQVICPRSEGQERLVL